MIILIKWIVSKGGARGMAEHYSTEPKEQTTFRIDKNLYDDLTNYSDIKGLNKGEAINEILFKFFDGATLTNTYLTNKAGLYFKVPLDMEIKKECINGKIKLNTADSSSIIGDNAIGIKINKIPNNLDVFNDGAGIGGSFTSNTGGVLHSGIDFVFNIHAISKPTTIHYSIELLNYLYCFYFEVKADNTTSVYLINPYDAINKLSNVNNRILGDRLIDMVEQLEEIQQQANFNYKVGRDNLNAAYNNVSDDKISEWLNNSFMALWVDLINFYENNKNDNIKLPAINENTPTRVIPCNISDGRY